MIKNNFYKILLGITFLIAVILRFAYLDKSPPSLGFDEAALGYNAYSIMKTGRDEYGNILPLSLRSFNDYKPALYAYLTIPFIKIFGLNDSAVRMCSASAGVISLWFLFLILKSFIKDKWQRLFIFFILSFEAWRLHYSRNAFEAHLSSCFFIIGIWFLLKTREKIKYWWGVVIFLALSAYSYHSARLAAPLLILLWIFDPIKIVSSKNWIEVLNRKIKFSFKKLKYLGIFLILCLPIFIANNSALLLTRFKQENVFNRYYPYAPESLVNPISKVYYLFGIISGHIFAYISPINLGQRIFNWVKGSPQYIPGMSMLGWIETLVFVFGISLVIKNVLKNKKYRLLVYWLLAGIAPAAATWNWFHPLRSLNIFPTLEIIVALGFLWLIKKLKTKKFIIFPLSLVLVISIIFTINNELLYSAFENHGEYQPGGFKEGMPYLVSIQDKYQQVIIDSPHSQNFIFLFYYGGLDPNLVQKYASVRPKPGIEGNLDFNFDKYVFRAVDWPKDKVLKNTIFWSKASVTDQEVNAVPGALIRMKVNNVLYHTADIITTE